MIHLPLAAWDYLASGAVNDFPPLLRIMVIVITAYIASGEPFGKAGAYGIGS